MGKNDKTNKLTILGVLTLLIPPLSLLIMVRLPSIPEWLIQLLFLYTLLCFVVPFLYGILLVFVFFKKRSGVILILSILNIFSPVWLFYLFMTLIISESPDFRLNM